MKAFSRQALGRVRPGLYRRGAAFSFRVSGGSFRGLTEAITSQSSITIFLLSPQLLYQSQEFHFPFLLF